jgi:two-component system sensor kinase FixL
VGGTRLAEVEPERAPRILATNISGDLIPAAPPEADEEALGSSQVRAAVGTAGPARQILHVRLLLLAALFLGFLALAEAMSGNPIFHGFGDIDQPVQPLAAISYIAIALALLVPSSFASWIAKILLAIPAIVVISTVVQKATGLSVQIKGWEPSQSVSRFDELFSGRLHGGTLVGVTMLTLAVAIARSNGRNFNRAAAASASVTLGVSLMSGFIALFDMAPSVDGWPAVIPSLPSIGQAIAISAAVLAWIGWPTWSDIPGRGRKQTKILRRAFPIIVLVPAMTGLIEVLATKLSLGSPLEIDIVAAGVNVAIFALLVVWSITRFAAEYPALWETTAAIESAQIALTSLDGKIFHWSRGCEDLYGWTADEVVGRQITEILQSRDVPATHTSRKVGNAVEQQREIIAQRRDATELHLIERVRLVDVDGSPPVLVYKMTDISERVLMEAALKESDANLMLALDARQISSFDWDIATQEIAVSPGTEERMGLEPGDLGTLSGWTERIDPADRDALFATAYENASRHSERYDFKYRINVPNGGVRSLEGSGRLIYNADGKFIRSIGVHIDVTDRNEREAALLAEEEQLRLVLETVPSAMFIFDELGIIRAFSASAVRLFGYSASEAIGRNVEMLAIGPKTPTGNSFVDQYLESRKVHVPAADGAPVTYALRRDGSFVPIELWMGDMHDGSKRLFTGFARDRTERLRSEERLSDMHDELLHASRLSAMGEMAAGLAHELNQPLAATVYFLGAADLVLSSDAGCEQGSALVKLGVEQALRAGEIIRRMRDFATREGMDMQAEQIGMIIDDAVSLAFLGQAKEDIKLAFELDPNVKTILADRVQIAQVLVNLLRNSTEELRKCAPEGRCIKISTRLLDAETIEIGVADTGPGLALPMLDHVYMPFISTKRENGMGVGLSICRRIIESHGGTFSAANNLTGGAVFRFTLSHFPVTQEAIA